MITESMTTPLHRRGRLTESMSELTPCRQMIVAAKIAEIAEGVRCGSCDGPEATTRKTRQMAKLDLGTLTLT